jgi:hypothetical protein
MDIYAWIYNIVNKEKENGKKNFVFLSVCLFVCYSNDLELNKEELKMKIRS